MTGKPDPLISVIMPAYNAAKFIEESIESVINQTYKHWELIIVDDGSTDNTETIVKNYSGTYSNIFYYHQENGRQGKARNLGLSNAKGTFIAFLDADDIWLPAKLEIQLLEIQQHKVDLVFSDAWMFESCPGNVNILMQSGKGHFFHEEGIKSFLEMNKIPVLTVLANTEALRSVGFFSENSRIQNAEDYHLWLKLLMNGNSFFGSEKPLAKYRVHTLSSSSNDKLATPAVIEAFEDLKRIFTAYRALITQYQRRWLHRFHYSTNHWQKKEYQDLIIKNCSYLGKSYLTVIFTALYKLAGLTVTRKLIAKTINA